MTSEIILALIATLTTLLAGYFKYREVQVQERAKQVATEVQTAQEAAQHIIVSMSSRVENLEKKQDMLLDKIYDVGQRAVSDREQLVLAYEKRIEALRCEMKALVEDSTRELEEWRDRYFKLMEEYQTLRLRHEEISIKFTALEEEVHKLRGLLQMRHKNDITTDINVG